MRRNKLVEAQQLGQRINMLAFAISPRTAFGYLAIVMMNLSTTTIEQLSSSAFKTLVQLFVYREPPSFYGLSAEIGALLDYKSCHRKSGPKLSISQKRLSFKHLRLQHLSAASILYVPL